MVKSITIMPAVDTEMIDEYIDQLSELEKKTLEIAKDHLGSSFSIEKSTGFVEWSKKQWEEGGVKR